MNKFKPTGIGLRAYRSGYQAGSNRIPRVNPYQYTSQKAGATAAWWETGYSDAAREQKDEIVVDE